jgi:hypothetical protein
MAQIFLRDPRFASKVFKMQDANLTRLPRPRFLFFVNFQPEGGQRPGQLSLSNALNNIDTGISFLAKTAERPRVRFATETLNQYNKKRVIQKQLEYQPVRISFYDTADDRIIKTFINYFRWYYGDPRVTNTAPWRNDSAESVFEPLNSFGELADSDVWPGYNPPTVASPTPTTSITDLLGQGRYFGSIDVITFGGNTLTGYRLVNPVMTEFSPDEMDASSNEVTTVSMTFEYEAVIWPEEFAPQTSLAPIAGTSGPNRGNQLTALIGNGEDAMSSNSAYLPPEQSVQITDYFPFKNPQIDTPVSDATIAGFNRFRPNLNPNVKQPLETAVRQTRGTSVFGGINFGTVTGNSQSRPIQPGTVDAPSGSTIPLLDLPRRLFSTFGGSSSSFNVPGTAIATNNLSIPINNDLQFQSDLTVQQAIYINQQQTSGTNGLWFDHARGLIQSLGFTSTPVVNALAQSLIQSSEVYGVSPTEIVKGFAATSKVNPNVLGVISAATINQTLNPSNQLGALGASQYDYSWNTQLKPGSTFAGYNSAGQPVNSDGQRIDGLGRAIDADGNPIVNVSSANQPTTTVGPQLNQFVWANNSTTTDSANLAALVLNKNV